MIFEGQFYPKPILIPANDLEYKRYARRSSISILDAAFLLNGFIPEVDDSGILRNPHLREIQDLYQDLQDGAESGKIEHLIEKNGIFKAPLLSWSRFLNKEDYTLPNALWDIFDFRLALSENTRQKQPPKAPLNLDQPFCSISNRAKLENEIVRVVSLFPAIPRKYYCHHPDVVLLKSPSMSEDAFEDLVTAITKKSNLPKRKRGCPPKDFLDAYEITHPELKDWFQKIRKKKKETSKIKS